MTSPDRPAREALVLTGRPGVPAPVGPFAHAVRWHDTLWVTGQMPTDPRTGLVVGEDVVDQTRQVMRNLEAVLTAAGARLADTLMVRAYLTDFDDYAAFNAEYATWFPHGLPARTCVGTTGLAVGALVEIDLVVGLPGDTTTGGAR
ncbi:RidA family protein [Cellulomonas sp. JZ18]|uniref:RidA family protein n=1 Tax=Cellulomonas sp. JZ18 TaxID=2654191 RepID=UPI0012D3E221|nr:RidA family protein [Cellulomonas sp. JZ18]QGQ18538.1 RidA family protein [Cellulomonas sp. JZ18]